MTPSERSSSRSSRRWRLAWPLYTRLSQRGTGRKSLSEKIVGSSSCWKLPALSFPGNRDSRLSSTKRVCLPWLPHLGFFLADWRVTSAMRTRLVAERVTSHCPLPRRTRLRHPPR